MALDKEIPFEVVDTNEEVLDTEQDVKEEITNILEQVAREREELKDIKSNQTSHKTPTEKKPY